MDLRLAGAAAAARIQWFAILSGGVLLSGMRAELTPLSANPPISRVYMWAPVALWQTIFLRRFFVAKKLL